MAGRKLGNDSPTNGVSINDLCDFGLKGKEIVLEEIPIKKLIYRQKDMMKADQAWKVLYFMDLISAGHRYFPPIIVDENLVVQDGEYRLEAVRRLGATRVLAFRPRRLNEEIITNTISLSGERV